MSKSSVHKRTYNSARRQAQAQQTRRQIREAALKLFNERGYNGATIDAIAHEAGVAIETVYATFGNKRSLLAHLLNVAVGGDEQPIPILKRPEPQAVLQMRDPYLQVQGFARGIADILERVAPVFEIMRQAAKTEPEISEMLQQVLQDRLKNITAFAAQVAANGKLREEMDEKRAGETVWSIASPEVFQLLTRDLGWSKEQYSQWLADILTASLLPPPPQKS